MLLATMSSSILSAFKRFEVLTILVTTVAVLAVASPASAKPPFSALAVDARNGSILFERDPDGLRHPASLTKVMTLYILFQELKAGRYDLNTPLIVSKRAAAMAPSKIGFRPGQSIRVEDAIRAIVTKSANDVAAAIAENISGNESLFAARMTSTARALGMTRTTFRNASGLPNPGQITTARDLATLALRVQRDFPQYYPYFRIMSFNYNGRIIKTHNRLLGKFEGTDGIKTGYTVASGFNLISSVQRGDRKIIGVVLGATSGGARNSYMMSMLSEQLPKCRSGVSIASAVGAPGAGRDVKVAQTETPQRINGKLKLTPPRTDMTLAELGSAPVSTESDDEDSAEAKTEDAAPLSSAVPDDSKSSLQTMIANAAQTEPLAAPSAIGTIGEPQQQPGPDAAGTAGLEQQASSLPFEVKKVQDGAWSGQIVVAAPAAAGEWNIQIGAFPDKRSAQNKLRQARKIGVPLLIDKQALTVTVQKGSEISYRARFSGFSEEDARAACRRLTEVGFGCVAVSPQS